MVHGRYRISLVVLLYSQSVLNNNNIACINYLQGGQSGIKTVQHFFKMYIVVLYCKLTSKKLVMAEKNQ